MATTHCAQPSAPQEDVGPQIAYTAISEVIGNFLKIPFDKTNPQHVADCVKGMVTGVANMIYLASRMRPNDITMNDIFCRYFATQDGQKCMEYYLHSKDGQNSVLEFLESEDGIEFITRHRSKLIIN